jgi:hypothetical protein
VSVLFYQRLEEMSRLPRGAAFFPMSRQDWRMVAGAGQCPTVLSARIMGSGFISGKH